MRFTILSKRFLAAGMLFCLSPMFATTQKPVKSGKSSYAHIVGKGTPANLSHHKDNSDIILRANHRNGPASELTKIEQQTIHSSGTSAAKPMRYKSAPLPKASVAKGERNTPINFAGHSAAGQKLKASGKSVGKSQGAVPKIH